MSVHPRAAELIRLLELAPHPEGGHYREVFRSPRRVAPAGGRPTRPALTTIYFLLTAGERSRWHRLVHDEAWHFHEGDPLELLWLDPALERVERRVLGAIGEARDAVAVVPAGCWQAARNLGAYSLVGCAMGPGFDFADFELMADHPAEAARLRERHPELAGLV